MRDMLGCIAEQVTLTRERVGDIPLLVGVTGKTPLDHGEGVNRSRHPHCAKHPSKHNHLDRVRQAAPGYLPVPTSR